MIQVRTTLGIWTKEQVTMDVLKLFQSVVMLFPIGIYLREHLGTLLGQEGAGTDRIKVEPDCFETGETFRGEAITANLIVEFALSTNPVAKLFVNYLN
jgi:hypothetical protein